MENIYVCVWGLCLGFVFAGGGGDFSYGGWKMCIKQNRLCYAIVIKLDVSSLACLVFAHRKSNI